MIGQCHIKVDKTAPLFVYSNHINYKSNALKQIYKTWSWIDNIMGICSKTIKFLHPVTSAISIGWHEQKIRLEKDNKNTKILGL